MPQNSLIDKPAEQVSMTIHDLTWVGDPGFRFEFREKAHGEISSTTIVVTLRGLEVDFAGTMIKEAAHAWLYGEAGDVAKAVQAVRKQARAHAKAHESDSNG